jgi:hypothetical protein
MTMRQQRQLSAFHSQLEVLQRYLLANSICEGLSEAEPRPIGVPFDPPMRSDDGSDNAIRYENDAWIHWRLHGQIPR